jgi:nucleoid-associated protein YgaU
MPPTASVSVPAAPQSAIEAAASASPRAIASASRQSEDTQIGQPPAVAGVTPPPTTATASNDRPERDSTGSVVVPSIETMKVVRGDNLWRISRTTYGNGARYSVIYAANRKQISDPDMIYPGQIFVLPSAPPKR